MLGQICGARLGLLGRGPPGGGNALEVSPEGQQGGFCSALDWVLGSFSRARHVTIPVVNMAGSTWACLGCALLTEWENFSYFSNEPFFNFLFLEEVILHWSVKII